MRVKKKRATFTHNANVEFMYTIGSDRQLMEAQKREKYVR